MSDAYVSLGNEFSILHLIYHRNKNQHRALCWWKYLNMMHRHVRQILMLHSAGSPKVLKAVQEFQRRKILDKAFWEFNGIIALGQFVTLGLTLVGLVSRVWVLLGEISPAISVPQSVLDVSTDDQNLPSQADTDFGVVVTVEESELVEALRVDGRVTAAGTETVTSVSQPAPKRTEYDDIGPAKKKSKKSKKKKKSAMDSIFG